MANKRAVAVKDSGQIIHIFTGNKDLTFSTEGPTARISDRYGVIAVFYNFSYVKFEDAK